MTIKDTAMDVHIRDSNIFNDDYRERPNPYFTWVWDKYPAESNIVVLTDNHLSEVDLVASRIRVALLLEPPAISPGIYDYIKKNYSKFDMVFTFDESLLSLGEPVRYYSYGTTWVHENDRGLHDKSKMVSAVFSSKALTDNHIVRHKIYKRFKNNIDFFGSIADNFIENKADGLRDYAFSVVVENWSGNSYYSEKLMDCLLTGTIPIYYGFPKYGEFFDPDGFIYFETVDELEGIIGELSMDTYNKKRKAIEYNFKKASEYIYLEKSLWENGLKQFDI